MEGILLGTASQGCDALRQRKYEFFLIKRQPQHKGKFLSIEALTEVNFSEVGVLGMHTHAEFCVMVLSFFFFFVLSFFLSYHDIMAPPPLSR